jgi:hypothetical protein
MPVLHCRLLERPNVIMRDVEPWEAAMQDLAWARAQEAAKRYPAAVVDLFTATAGSLGQPVLFDEQGRPVASDAATESGTGGGGTKSDKKARGKEKDKDKEEGVPAGRSGKAAKTGNATATASAPEAAKVPFASDEHGVSASAAAADPKIRDAGQSFKRRAHSASDFLDDDLASALGAGGADVRSAGGIASRISSADKIGDVRSSDRAYTQE